MQEAKHFIGGEWASPAGNGTISSVDPSDGQPFARFARGTAADVDTAVRAAGRAFEGAWGSASAAERSRVLYRLSLLVTASHETLAQLEARDTGKPLGQARADTTALARYFAFYAGAAGKLHGESLPCQSGYAVFTIREPHGITGHIVPWNYPMQILGRNVGAALATGNACVVKPAETACLSVLRVAALAAEAGLPPGALNIVTGYGHEAGAALAGHPGIGHLSFSGSLATGRRVAQMAAENHVPVTLETNGPSAQIVFADADLDAALPALVSASVRNAGQTGSAGSRVLIDQTLYEPLLDRLGAAFKTLRAGPARADLDCGPLISAKHQHRVWDFLSDAHRDGIAMAAHGEVVPEAPATGFYQAPTLLRDVPPAHRLAREEVFGPLLAAAPFTDEDEAVALANRMPSGRVTGIWTRAGARQLRVARRLGSGQVFINSDVAGDGVELPFGGIEHSGHRREKGFEALHDFTVLKTIAIRHG